MKKRIIALAAAIMLLCAFGAAACGGRTPADPTAAPVSEAPTDKPADTPAAAVPTEAPETEEPVRTVFVNGLPYAVEKLYISVSESDTWGDPAAYLIGSGSVVPIDEAIAGRYGSAFDFGPYDENGVNYDAFSIVIYEGDTVTLTGDNTAARYVVEHRNGSKDEYDAVLSGGAEEQGGAIPLEIERSTEFAADLQTGETTVFLVSESVHGPVPDRANERFYAYAHDIFEELLSAGDTGDGEQPLCVKQLCCIRRADTACISILAEIKAYSAGECRCSYLSAVIDTGTGRELSLTDAVTDPALFIEKVNSALDACGAEIRLDRGTDYYIDCFDRACSDLAWTLEPSGIGIVLNPGCFGTGLEAPVSVMIPFAAQPGLVKPEYAAAPENYAMMLPIGLTTYCDPDGSGNAAALTVDGSIDDLGQYHDVLVKLGSAPEGEAYADDWLGSELSAVYLHTVNGDQVYVNTGTGETYLLVFDIDGKRVTYNDDPLELGFVSYYEGETLIRIPATDPAALPLMKRSDFLADCFTYSNYDATGGNGPVPKDELAFICGEIRLTVLRELKGSLTDGYGTATGEERTAFPGETVFYVAADNKRYAWFCIDNEDSDVIRVLIRYDEYEECWMIDGIPVNEVLSGFPKPPRRSHK